MSDRHPAGNRRLLGSMTHLIMGGALLAAFLISGAYMRFRTPHVSALEPGLHVMFTSRHIYILAVALVHLVLGAYAQTAHVRWAQLLQVSGSIVLVLSGFLLVLAFIVEPMSGNYRTWVSSFGLYTLLGGALLHVVAGISRRTR